ncbi:methyl-accepting chemotaxis protein [Methylomonas sp. AM2-LC]|uniref:methyl-accepting chemotaxis protein n=1 Tax=Methylomonas sp. AM2-LC TaxID=3153301 RepID=UPI0032633B02
MNFKAKLKLLSIVTLVGLCLVASITAIGLHLISDANETVNRRNTYVIDLLEIKASAVSTIMLDPTSAETKTVFTEAEQSINQHSDSVLKLIKRTEVKEELKQILALWTLYDQHSQVLITLAVTDPVSANQKLIPLYNQEFKPFQVKLDQFISVRRQEASQAIEQAKQISTKIYWGISLLLIFVTLANLWVVLNLSRSLRNGLLGIQQKLLPLKNGDLKQRLPTHTKDELSEISSGVNEFISEFARIVETVRNDANQLSVAANELAIDAQQVLISSNQQSNATASVAATVEEFTVSIDSVSNHASEAEHDAEHYGELSRQGGSDVKNAVAEIQRIEQAVNNAVEKMHTLGQQAHEISSIVEVIKNVADQTNLLALNAAIEAARAGESGRGFSVVADEVRNLAERTSKSALEITTMISGIQQNTDKASSVMQQGNERVIVGVKQAELAVHSMQQIDENTQNVMNSINYISSALKEQRIAGNEIAKNVGYISQITEKNCAAVSHVSLSAARLNKLATELNNEMAKFNLN